MSSPIRTFFETIMLYCKGFRPVEFVRDDERISLHPSGWRVNGSGKFKRAKDAVDYLESASPEQWRQIYCGMTPFLVSDKGNVKHVDGSAVKMTLANGRYQIMYKPEDARGRGRDGRIHKKRVYRSMLVAMAWLDFRKGDTDHEIHHINGYRTDDRVANLMVVDHDEHLRIHNLGPCALSGLPDERIVEAAATCAQGDEAPETFTGSHVALKPAADGQTGEPRKKKRRRGKRGGKGRSAEQATEATSARDRSAHEAEAADEHAAADASDGAVAAAAASETPDKAVAAAAPASDTPDERTGEKSARRKKNRNASQSRCDAEPCAETRATAASDGAEAARPNDAAEKKRNAGNDGIPQKSPRDARADEHARTPKQDAAPKPGSEQDRAASRERLAATLDGFLEAIRANDPDHVVDEKGATKAAKPVYRALKPYSNCPDSIDAFDAALSSIRTIAQAYSDSGAAMPAPVHSMIGTLHQVLKDAVKRIAAQGDEVETACLRELLVDEASKPLFKKTMHARKFRQCISVVDSRNETAPE